LSRGRAANAFHQLSLIRSDAGGACIDQIIRPKPVMHSDVINGRARKKNAQQAGQLDGVAGRLAIRDCRLRKEDQNKNGDAAFHAGNDM